MLERERGGLWLVAFALLASPTWISLAGMTERTEQSVLFLLHGLVSAGAEPNEKTIDAAIKGASILDSKLAALRPAEPDSKRGKEILDEVAGDSGPGKKKSDDEKPSEPKP